MLKPLRKNAPILVCIIGLMCLVMQARAQHFEWAASSGNIDIRYAFSAVDSRNNLVVGGTASRNWTHNGAPEIYNSSGIASKLGYNEFSELIVSYAPNGTINWFHQLDSRYNELNGICIDENGSIVLLVYIKPEDYDEQERAIGYLSLLVDPKPVPAGFSLVYLDSDGSYLSMKHAIDDEESKITISSFIPYPNGGFVLSGFANPGKICKALKVEAGKGGGDFVLVLDKNGQADWADIVSYGAQSCCSYLSDMCKAAVAPDGTVYLGGTYYEGGTFGGSKKIVSPTSPEDNQYNKPYEAYIACYSARGKLNWVKTSVQKALFHSIAANNSGVLAAVGLVGQNHLFNETVDTSRGRTLILTAYNPKGNQLWYTSTNADRIHAISYDNQSNIYILGTMNEVGRARKYGQIGIIGSDSLQKRTDLFIARFNNKGKYQWVKEAELPITTSNEPILFNMDHCGNLFVSGTIFFSFKAQLSMFDKAFVKGQVYGPAPFVSRFKNTLPVINTTNPKSDSIKVEKNKVSEIRESCIISPGPWKIQNYPNPFTVSTTFDYTISYADYVTLELHDMNGALVSNVFSGKKHESGKYTYFFDQNLAAGTYIATLKGSETIATCRIVVGK
jgi:hypothetical protein